MKMKEKKNTHIQHTHIHNMNNTPFCTLHAIIHSYDMTIQFLINEHEVRNSTLAYRDTDYKRGLHTKDRSKERHAISHGMF